MKRIASRENPLFRELALVAGSARERRKRDACLLEGVHLCEAFLEGGGAPRRAVVSTSGLANAEVAALVRRLREPAVELADALFGALSSVEHGVGVAFLVDTPRPGLPARIDHDCVYLDRLQDPGNVGTILRSCAGAGVARVVTAPGTAQCWSPKVLRAGMGAHFALHLVEGQAPDALEALAVPLLATSSHASTLLHEAALPAPAAWVFGHEGQGIADALQQRCAMTLAIPQPGGEESLNVAAAAAVCLYQQAISGSRRG